MKKRILAILLCSIMLMTASIVSCGNSDSESDVGGTSTSGSDESQTTASDKEPDPIELRKQVADELPEKDFGGSEFRIVVESDQDEQYYAEEENGDVINDAVYARNLAVEERFNVKIVLAKADEYDKNGPYIEKAILAGDDEFDLAAHHVVNAGSLAAKELFTNWYDVPHINFEKPWWSSSTVDNLTYKGVALLAVGDLALTSIGRTYCVFFDKVKAESYGINDIYGMVNSGAWTIDKLSELTKDIYVDVNADDKRDYDDFYGFSSGSASNVDVYLWAFDNPIIKTEKDDSMSVCVRTDKINSIVEKLVQIMNENKGTYFNKDYVSKYDSVAGGHKTSRDMFIDGNVIFANGYVDFSIDYFRDIKNDFGIIPYPKWNEEQANYITMADGNHASLAVPKSAQDMEKIGIITEALCAESYKTLVPAYYETALKVKYTRDSESIEVLDMLINSRVFDFGYVYDAWKGCSFYLEELVKKKDINFESYYAKNENKIIKHYQDIFDVFEEYTVQ